MNDFKRRSYNDRDSYGDNDRGFKNESAPKDVPHNSMLFIIGGKTLSEKDFRDAFEHFGEIERIDVKRQKGISYIKFSKTSEAAEALEAMNGKSIGSDPRPLKIVIASSSSLGNSRDDVTALRISVVIPKSFDEEELKNKFSEFGPIEYVSVVKDKQTNQNRGFGYVKFFRFSHAVKAYEECDSSFKPKFADPTPPRDDRGSERSFGGSIGSYEGGGRGRPSMPSFDPVVIAVSCLVSLGLGALVVRILQLQLQRIRIKVSEKRKDLVSETESKDPKLADPWKVTCYRSLPLRHMSRLWGAVNELYLPKTVKNWVLGAYITFFECDLSEAEHSDLDSYQNLGQFFRRRLKPGVRVVEEGECLVSPCDGKVLHWGRVGDDGLVEQVKGVTYKLQHFLGQNNPTDISLDTVTGGKKVSSEPPPITCLYQCVLYLAPGDYHCFHSPTDWEVTTRRHFPGELLSVNPGIVSKIRGLFSLNERVAYFGRWKHGFFSMTAVGATNVGSIKIGFDPNLVTNMRKCDLDTFHQEVWEDCVKMKKGDYFGEFNLGSTIVLIFEAPEDFNFSFDKSGDIVRMGKAIGEQCIKEAAATEMES